MSDAAERDRAQVRRMCAAIRHRGPDDEGIHVEEGVALGMRRLSIIDVATGQQPIANEDGTVRVVFNGEIYNYVSLRADLKARGHRFSTASDTETIVHAYEEWGEDAFAMLRGMFAIALWDRRNRVLLLARDRVGIKPLHYSVASGRLYFGSEIKSILARDESPPALNLEALDHYLSFLYTPRDATIFAGIHKLPPGHVLRWQDGMLRLRQFWQLPADEQALTSETEAIDRLRAVLRDAVRSHLRARCRSARSCRAVSTRAWSSDWRRKRPHGPCGPFRLDLASRSTTRSNMRALSRAISGPIITNSSSLRTRSPSSTIS
jgi:asparagine synthase (glutamine-hydrolysing)